MRATDRLDYFQRRLVSVAFVGLELGVIYALVTFILRQFPYTRPWGESLRESLLTAVGHLALEIVNAMPRLFMICAIIVITRFAIGLLEPWFDAVGRGAVKVPVDVSGDRQNDPPAGDHRPLVIRGSRWPIRTCRAATPRRSKASASLSA